MLIYELQRKNWPLTINYNYNSTYNEKTKKKQQVGILTVQKHIHLRFLNTTILISPSNLFIYACYTTVCTFHFIHYKNNHHEITIEMTENNEEKKTCVNGRRMRSALLLQIARRWRFQAQMSNHKQIPSTMTDRN